MIELDEKGMLEIISHRGEPLAVFLQTPFCGTCKAARKMLEVAAHLLPEEIRLASGNINLLPGIVSRYRISSVPALMVLGADRVHEPDIHYAFRSVEDVLAYIRRVES